MPVDKVRVLTVFGLLWLANCSLNAEQTTDTANEQSHPSVGSDEHVGEPSPFKLKVATRMVLVDVVVTGKDGKPVGDLKADDFEILENGRKQAIKAFGSKAAEIKNAQPPVHQTLLSGQFTNTVDFHPEEGPAVILLIDALNTPWADQVYGRAQLLEYLNNNRTRRNIAIYGLSHRLQLLQDFTEDSSLLREALGAKDGFQLSDMSANPQPGEPANPSSSGIAGPERASVSTNTPEAGIAQLKQQLNEMQNTVTQFERDNAIEITLDALTSLARHAAAVPGRKQLLWLSAGFPLSFEVVRNSTYYQKFARVANLLTDAQIAVYPVDVRGLVAFYPNEMETGMAELTSMHLTMNDLASRTGGLAFYGRNDLSHAIELAVDDGATYYVLGYYPTDTNWDGGFRAIQVKLRRPELHARHRNGYFAVDAGKMNKSQSEAARLDFFKALGPEILSARMLPMLAQVSLPDKEHSQVFVDVRVDPRSVVFDIEPNQRQAAELEFVTAVLDATGKLIVIKRDSLKTNLTPETFQKVMASSLSIRQKIYLVPGKYLLKIGARDVKSNLIGTLNARVEVLPQN